MMALNNNTSHHVTHASSGISLTFTIPTDITDNVPVQVLKAIQHLPFHDS
jgi:hypothetical protein